MNLSYATSLLNKNKEDYNRIADSFDSKRGYIPKDFEYMQKFIKKNEKVLDLGCGNGRLAELIDDEYLGADVSEELIRIAKEKYPDKRFIILNNSLRFPFKNDEFDKVFCLSVFHHTPSKAFRKQLIQEIKRILKPGGILILTVWNLKGNKKTKEMLWKYSFKKIFFKSKLDFKDIFYPWKDSKGNILAERYVHVFSQRELKRLILKQRFKILELKTIDRSLKGSNILIVCQKCS
ncbi:MAG: class I SAM-dependent methyltransferase [Candidatus Pacebacteria bacterium]|nr:class I SAM-dependent methyltransferase [Candidatus Paceibacterota bacterium]